MNSLRRWLYRPKRSDASLLAQFYFADEDLNQVAAELDSFEGRKDPERCTSLVNQLRACQARVLNVVSQMMDEQVKDFRASRDFRVKFPDDVIQENLAGQLWFGAECLAAGSSIMNREVESACMRPLARALTKNLDSLRNILREQCLHNVQEYTETIKESLIIFDKLFAEFELSYVSAMVPVKTAHEYDLVQEITVLFSETVQRALAVGLLTSDMIDEYDPALMFTIPRLAIVSGVHVFKDGPLNPDNDPWNLSEMFRPFQTLLLKIRELLGILTDEELNTLERALCSQEEPSFLISLEERKKQNAREERRKSREERKYKSAISKKRKDRDESDDGSIENELTALEIAERLEALALNFVTSRNAKLTQSNEHSDLETQNKSSESMSTSSSSFLSEVEAEDEHSVDVEKVNEANHADNVHEQHFKNQQANLNSHIITQEVSVGEHHNAFSPECTDASMHNSTSESATGNDSSDATHSDSSNTSSAHHDHNKIEVGLETAAIGRANFAMNKCDSNDSGLHSEVLSNSDSTFTISSNDSNQHVPISDAPGTSDCHDGYQDPSLLAGDQTATDHHSTDVLEHVTRVWNGNSSHIEIESSSDTLVSDSEVNNLKINLCLQSPSGCRDDVEGAISGDIITVFPVIEQHQVLNVDGATKHLDSSDKQSSEAAIKVSINLAISDLCLENLISHKATDIASQESSQPSESLSKTSMQTSEIESKRNHDHSYIQKIQDSSWGYNIEGLECPTSSIAQEIASRFPYRLQENSHSVSEQQNGLNYSNVVVEKSDFEHSKSNQNVDGNLCDNNLPERNNVCNNLHDCSTSEMLRDTSLEITALICGNSDAFTSEPFHTHSAVPGPTVSEDRENNNEIKLYTTLNQTIDVPSYGDIDSTQSGVLQKDVSKDTLQTEARENQTDNSSEHNAVIFHSSTILAKDTATTVSPSAEVNVSLSEDTITALNANTTTAPGVETTTAAGVETPTAISVDTTTAPSTETTTAPGANTTTAPSAETIIAPGAETTTALSVNSSSFLLHSTTDVQDSGKLTLNLPPPPSHNEIQDHTSTTNESNLAPPGPETSMKRYKSVKGSSKARSLKKSSKMRRQPQETSSHLGQRSGLPSQAKALIETQLLDSECNHSSETSSYNSDCGDQEEIDLAIKAAENATRQQVRARFQSSSDMIHRLFVCISGVADQLQTNFAGDLRNILRAVFDMNCSEPVDISAEDKCKDTTPLEAAYSAMSHASRTARRARNSTNQKKDPPSWLPDEQSNECMSCQVPFTFVRRRHHCRNCGKIFCSRCSSNFVPLPHFGQDKAVRVCNRCFMFQVTPFTVRPTSSH